MTVAKRVAELSTLFGRLVNSHDPRVEVMTVRVSETTKARLQAMAEEWQAPRSTVAAEVLEAAMCEAWAAFVARRVVMEAIERD